MNKLSHTFKKYFWDVDFDKLDVNTNDTFIIERLLEHGDLDAFKWIDTNFSKETIENTIKTSRRLSRKSANFYAVFYDIDKGEILCMNKPYTLEQNRVFS